jgi:hypothetical protein
MNFHKLVNELDAAHESCAEQVAAGIVNQVSEWATANGYPLLIRAWTPAAQVIEVRRYLAEAISATKTQGDELLTLNEAAKVLGYTASGLRRIVNRTKAGGQGPTINFLQVGQGPIKFRHEWLDEFIKANTLSPQGVERQPKKQPAPSPVIVIEPRYGFDPSFLRR